MKHLLIIVAAFLVTSSAIAQTQMGKKMHGKAHHKMAMPKNGLMMEDGKMMQMKDGKSMMMDKDMKMSNGSMVMMDGSMKMKNGKTVMLKDGDCVMMNGKMTHKPMKKKMAAKM
jgi:uncharacterized protein YdeI (BOF family)